MNKELKNIIKSFEGNVLGFNLSDTLIKELEKNNKIIDCNILSSNSNGTKRKFFDFSRSIKIKKLRKVFKKKKIDYILCEYTSISKYLNTFVKDSVYINKNKLYLFGEVDVELINKRYSRYNTKIVINKFKNNYIVEIDNSDAKNNFFKDLGYRVIDFLTHLLEVIGDVLMGW